jgi:hypothetical protein
MFWKNQHLMEPVLEDLRFTDPSVPSRACCCLARPAVKVIMPSGAGRPNPVDLWLCGHHYRASVKTLLAAGATIQDLTFSDRGPEHADQVAAPA